MKRNTGSQKWRVFAFLQNTNAPLAGDAAQIVGRLTKDFGSEVATNDTNPTDVTNGYYDFTLTQAETNAHTLQLRPYSSTTNCVVLACPATITTVPWNSITDLPNTDVGGLSGDVPAADSLETMLDGTGGNKLTLEQLKINSSNAAGGLYIVNSGGPGINSSGSTYGAYLSGTGTAGLYCITASGNEGIYAQGPNYGAYFRGISGPGFYIQGTTFGLQAVGSLGSGIGATGAIGNHGILATGGNIGGDGIRAVGGTGGYDINADIHGVVDGACGVNTTQVATGVTTALNTSIPSSPTANSTFHYLKIVDAVLLGTTNVSGSQVQFRDRSNTVATTITYSATDGGRDTVVIV